MFWKHIIYVLREDGGKKHSPFLRAKHYTVGLFWRSRGGVRPFIPTHVAFPVNGLQASFNFTKGGGPFYLGRFDP